VPAQLIWMIIVLGRKRIQEKQVVRIIEVAEKLIVEAQKDIEVQIIGRAKAEEERALTGGVLTEEKVQLEEEVLKEEGAQIGEQAQIEEGAQIREGAQIGGGVQIGEGAQIEERAQIGEGAQIREEAQIEDGVLIREGARIEEEAQIEEGAQIGGGAQIGEGALIGVLIEEEGAKIGDKVLIGIEVQTGKVQRSRGEVLIRDHRLGHIEEAAVVAMNGIVGQDTAQRGVDLREVTVGVLRQPGGTKVEREYVELYCHHQEGERMQRDHYLQNKWRQNCRHICRK